VSRRLVGTLILIAFGVGVGWAIERYRQYRQRQVE